MAAGAGVEIYRHRPFLHPRPSRPYGWISLFAVQLQPPGPGSTPAAFICFHLDGELCFGVPRRVGKVCSKAAGFPLPDRRFFPFALDFIAN
jgi:hypothetical protein